ncbi:L-glyceraldehyde 3-phosphate reductase [Undibacterium sp. GrIS 1.8]|uniref:aldo/keto reductase n=1 Tax=Undibacterium sp. GrIS 1.8 TaxID=3143934 RepID=UPI0033959808
MIYQAHDSRYGTMAYRRSGRSGLKLPSVSLGLWQNFGDINPIETQRAMLRRAFDRGVTHFDLANNYGPPFGAAERNFGRLFAEDFKSHRDELVISTKAGWDMWPGPYGGMNGSKKHLVASLDQSLQRMGLDYVDIFYSHRPDPHTPIEETMGALAQLVRQGKALYIGISNYGPALTQTAADCLRAEGMPLTISQPNYSLLDRWIEPELLAKNTENGVGTIVFSPLQQGFLTDRYLKEIPADSRASRLDWVRNGLNSEVLVRIKALNQIALERGQSLAQMALAWTLRDDRITSTLIGARTVAQLDDSLDTLNHLHFTTEEIQHIDVISQSDPDVFSMPAKATGQDLVDNPDFRA